MTFARLDNLAMRLVEKIVGETENLIDGARSGVETANCRYSHDSRQGERRNAERGVADDYRIEP